MYSLRAGWGCFLPLPLPSGLTPVSACPPLPHPETLVLGLSPFHPLPGGVGEGHVHEAAIWGGPAAKAWGLMDLMPMADADTPALAQRETGPAQAPRPCGVRGGSLGEMGSIRARCLGAASAQQHDMALASCSYPMAASRPEIPPPILEKAAILQFSLVREERKACFIFVFKDRQKENRCSILQVSEALLPTRSSCGHHVCLPKEQNIPCPLPSPSALAFISLVHLIFPERSRRSPPRPLAAAGLLKP